MHTCCVFLRQKIPNMDLLDPAQLDQRSTVYSFQNLSVSISYVKHLFPDQICEQYFSQHGYQFELVPQVF